MAKKKSSSARKAKKTKSQPLTFSAFAKNLARSPLRLITYLVMLLVALFLPGQNEVQTLTFRPSTLPAPSPYPTPPILGPLPIQDPAKPPPALTAKGVMITDEPSRSIIFEKNATQHLMPASTTKIMTAYVALHLYDPKDTVTITNANESLGHKAELQPGETLSVNDLLFALLVSSGNDAAVALAQHHPKGYSAFIDVMNQTAKDLNLVNTHYSNASGIESDDHYSSARDLVILTREAMKLPLFREIVSTKAKTITSPDGRYRQYLYSTNELLGVIPGVIGVKTGWTELAGDCLVTYIDRDGHSLIIVLLGSTDRFGETTALINWMFNAISWVNLEDYLSSIPIITPSQPLFQSPTIILSHPY